MISDFSGNAVEPAKANQQDTNITLSTVTLKYLISVERSASYKMALLFSLVAVVPAVTCQGA